jgi:fimbrial chaperone protein
MRFLAHILAVCVTMLGIALPLYPALSMSVTPVVADISTTGNSNRTQITVANESASVLPIDIIVSRVELNENGEITTTPAGDEFLIVPPQALVPAGATQNFRVQWVGDPQIKTSQSYIFSVNQVPVKMPKGESGVQVVLNFATIINVAPPGGQASVNLVGASIGKDDKGKPRPALTVKNLGNAHAKLTDATITLSGGDWSQTLTPSQLRLLIGVGLLQPGKTRKFLLPVDLPAKVTQITANIDYKPRK